MLAFAHLVKRRDGDAHPDPVAEVGEQARAALGELSLAYTEVRQDSSQPVPRGGALTFTLKLPGCEVNPPARSFAWVESVHKEEFRLRAPAELVGQTVRGRLVAFLGPLLLAELTVAITVVQENQDDIPASPYATESVSRYRKIFASYSHKDEEMVAAFRVCAAALGDEYLVDCTHLRAGEVWDERLERLIDTADVFQLFWSWNSMTSQYVRREWEYALRLRREQFVRPTYWEEPLPSLPEHGLPPEELRRLHFQRIDLPRFPSPFFWPPFWLSGRMPPDASGRAWRKESGLDEDRAGAERFASRKRQMYSFSFLPFLLLLALLFVLIWYFLSR